MKKIILIISIFTSGVNAQSYKNIADKHSLGLYYLEGNSRINWNGNKIFYSMYEKYNTTIGVTYLNKYYLQLRSNSTTTNDKFINTKDGGGKSPWHVHRSDFELVGYDATDLGFLPVKFKGEDISLKLGINLSYVTLNNYFYSSYQSPHVKSLWYVIENKDPNIMHELGGGGSIWVEFFHNKENAVWVDLIINGNISPHMSNLSGGIHLGILIK
jgi:hypothetical protein